MTTPTKPKSNRLVTIDQFRGLTIILMVLANYLGGVHSTPAWLRHAPDIGLTIIDLIAPCFIFAIGLTYGLSWKRRRATYGKIQTYQHFFTRFMAILGIGALLSAGEIWLQVDDTTINWGVLQAIGAAGILTLLVIELPTAWRALIGLGLLGAYQTMLDQFWLATVLQSPHGGLAGSLSWGGMMILATVLADLFHDPARHKLTLPLSALTLLAGSGLAFLIPVSKQRVSFSYVLISLGISALLFLLIDWLVTKRKLHIALLDAWGKNPLALYILHLILLGIVFLPGIPGWYSDAAPWLVTLQVAGLIGVLSFIALWLEKKHIQLSL